MLVGMLEPYVEDFTANDIQIDQWNGRIAKENVKIRPTAFDWIFTSAFGAPCEIVQGYIKKVVVDVPWTQILSKPVELKIEEIHIIIKSRDRYDREFVKNSLFQAKKEQIDKILAEINKQMEQKVQEIQTKDSYISKMTKIIYENLRINVRNLHIRFEDTNISRCDQAFNFGFMAESISYSMTNNRFSKAFLNIDDKIQEQKSFSLLLVTKFAVYWNSNAQDNWTKNREFINLTAQGTIDFSKRHTDNLLRKHYTNKNDFNSNNTGVFLVQPCNWSLKFRTNLAPLIRPEIPESTTVWESSEITLALDEEVYKDVQYLTKFFAWHANSVQKTSYLKFRPPYNQPIFGNAGAYWKYAIKATIYMLRKEKQKSSKQLNIKRQNEMILLAEIYKLEAINKYLKQNGQTDRLLYTKQIRFRDELQLQTQRKHLEYKLTAEQIVVSTKQAEKESQTYIQEHQLKSGWRSWVPTVFKTTFWTGGAVQQHEQQDSTDQMEIEFQKQVDLLVQKSKLIEINKNGNQQNTQKLIASQFVFQVPIIQFLIVNKQDGAYNAKCFMSFVIQDMFYQNITFKNNSTSYYFSIRSFEIIDKLLQSPKFQRIIFKKPVQQNLANVNKRAIQKLQSESYNQNLGQEEAEEESNLFINNGLPQIRNFSEVARISSDCDQLLLLFQLNCSQTVHVDNYRLDLLVNQVSMFYNRALIARAETFMHHATINQVQNAAAEADFDERVQALQQRTEKKVNEILKKSEFEVACTFKGLELVIPDETSFDQARFLMLQTGNIALRSKHELQTFQNQRELDGYFLQQINRKTKKILTSQMLKSKNKEDFALTLYDIQLFFLHSSQQLELVMYNEVSKEEIDKLYALLRKTDIQIQVTKTNIDQDNHTELLIEKNNAVDTQSVTQLNIIASNIDFRTNNKELKELKGVADNLIAYHVELADQVLKELVQIKFQHQLNRKFNMKQQHQKRQFERTESNMTRQVIQQMGSQQNLVKMSTFNSSNGAGSDSGDDEFFDAQDYFDPQIFEMINMTKKPVVILDQEKESNQQITKSTQMYLLQFHLGKFKCQIMEAQSNILKKEDPRFKNDLQQLISNGNSINKGIPFLSLEVSKTTITLFQSSQNTDFTFTMKEFCILNIEKQSAPQILSRSSNFVVANLADINQRKGSLDLDTTHIDEEQIKQIFDLENEDNLAIAEQPFEDINDYYLKLHFKKSIQQNEAKIEFGITEIEISESSMRKLIDVLFLGWPQNLLQLQDTAQASKYKTESQTIPFTLNASLEGFVFRMRIKQNVSTLKVLGIQTFFKQDDQTQISIYLEDFQVMHHNNELVFKHNYFSDDLGLPVAEEEDFEARSRILNLHIIQVKSDEFTDKIDIRGNLQNLLVILETPSILQMIQNGSQILKSVKPILHQSNSKPQPLDRKIQSKNTIMNVNFEIASNHLQIPVKENKNSLFIQVRNLKVQQKENDTTILNLKSLNAFVAKQIEQENKYYLFDLQGVTYEMGKGSLNQELQVGTFIFTLNENFILFLAQLIDYHFEEMINLAQFFEKQPVQMNDTSGQLDTFQTEVSDFISEDIIESLTNSSPFVKSIVATLVQTNSKDKIKTFSQAKIEKIEIQWVTGMSFEDHEENFVTLHNRNFTKLILEQFDRKRTGLDVEKEFDFEPNFQSIPNDLLRQKSSPVEPEKSYERLVFRIENILVETAQTQSVFSAVQVKQVTLENIVNQQIQTFFLIQPGAQSQAISIAQGMQQVNVKIHLVDIRICQQNAAVVSNLIKAAYSCKNVVQRGKKRKLFKTFFEQQQATGKTSEQKPADFVVRVKRIRLVIFEQMLVIVKSKQNETQSNISPGQVFIDTMTSKAVEKFQITDEKQSVKGNGVVVLETGVQITSQSQLSLQEEQEELENFFAPDSQLKCRLTGLQIYLNAKHTSVADFLAGEKRLIILYPLEITVEQQFFTKKNLCITDISLSLIELELSFKQIFFLTLLASRISEELVPIVQILEHIDQQNKRQKRGQENENVQKLSQLQTISFSSIYFALIKESAEQINEMEYQSDIGALSIPMLSLEVKWLQIKQKIQMTGLQSTDIAFPLEIYYFNQKLSFFEPVIERVPIKCYFESGGVTEKQIQKLTIEDVLNLNFSVALYENLFLLLDNFKSEFTEYNRQIELSKKETEFGSNVKQSSQERSATAEEHLKNVSNFVIFSPSSYFIKNKTGELLMFMAGKKPAFTELQPNEMLPLDFQKHQLDEQSDERIAAVDDLDNTLSSNRELFEGVPSSQIQPNSNTQGSVQSSTDDEDESLSSSSDENSYLANVASINYIRKTHDTRKPCSPYRRGQFKFKKSEPNRVQLQVSIQRGKQIEKTLSFEINFDSLTCQRVYLDEQRELYVICQTQIKEGQKHLIVRSPMQVTNNLQIPIEVQLLQTTQPLQKQQSTASLEESKEEKVPKLLFQKQSHDYNMIVKPGASQIIPLKACSFDHVQIRPIIPLVINQNSASYKQDSQFEWSQKSQIKLLQDETMIFEQKPIVCRSRLSRNNRIVDRNNNQVFFVLNANTYSIRSYIDFNTQQTEFISLRYLSITSPYTIQNLIPVPITMLFKNIVRDEQQDKQLYDMNLKHNSSLQVLYLNPLGNFDFSITIPGYQQSNFIEFKIESDEDFQLTPDLLQKNYIDSGFEAQAEDAQTLLKKAKWRFVKQKRFLIQLCSQFQSQFNICVNVAFVQGFYHISFYSKYWFLNNTQMPLIAQVTKQTFSFPSLDLPYLSTEFDFETVKHFARDNINGEQTKEVDKLTDNGPTRPRLGSGETIQTIETQTVVESKADVQTNKINYAQLKKMIGVNVGCSNAGTGGYDLASQQKLLLLRLKPWEAYRAQQSTINSGLLAALNQEDIDRVSSIYFTQELIKEEQKEEQETIQPNNRDRSQLLNINDFQTARGSITDMINSQREMESPSILMPSARDKSSEGRRRQVQFDDQTAKIPLVSSRTTILNKAEKLTKMSKTSIQVTNFTQLIEEQQAVPLNHTPLSKFDLFPAPLQDKDQLKRVILFSDEPTEESQTASIGGTGDTFDNQMKSQNIRLKICNSEWCELPFDLAKLQSEPIKIKDDVREKNGSINYQPQSLFEIVSVVSFLPQPFSFSKLICFQPRYLMVNRTYQTVTVVQAQCEELGTFKIFPQETSVFHWTDASKLLQICVKVDDHEFSGNISIDGIGEINLRLKSTLERDNLILNVSISEETNSFYIVFSDVSYAPPYRIENLTKTRFKVQQIYGRNDDFDRLNAFQTMSFAWSYPLQKKLLKITLCHLQSEEDLGSFNIDSISKTERIKLRDRQSKREYLLEITNEKTVKVVRILYPQTAAADQEKVQLLEQNKKQKLQVLKQKIIINRLGFSVVNNQARELCYVSFSNLRLCNETTQKHQKFSIKLGDLQIDNQLSRSQDAIILKRESNQRTGHFLSLKFLFVKNDAIENLLYYKYFMLDIVPFELSLDGNFCDETYKYAIDVFTLATKYAMRMKQGEIVGIQQVFQDTEFDPTAIRPIQFQYVDQNEKEVDQIKNAINELKKKGQPYLETSRDVQKIYFEQFQINEIRLSFTFSSSQILFREFTMNPTLKFLIVLLSNLKNVRLRFNKCHMQNQNLLLSIFLAQLKRFYWHEVSNHTQIFKIVSSMGIFGNLSDTLSNLTAAFKNLIYRPFDTDENKLKAVVFGSLVFMKDSISVLSGSVVSILDTLKQGITFLVQQGFAGNNGQNSNIVMDKDLFEDDIEQASRPLNNHFSTPLTIIDTQNRIWLKILTREKQNYDVKKRILRKQKEGMDQQEIIQPMINMKRSQQSNGLVYKAAVMTAQGIVYIPKKILQTSAGLLSIFLQDDDAPRVTQKVRPPRFVSFTLELEPYSKKKAFALEILNEINLNVIEAETIQKLYSMSQNVVIITGKRIICVEEQLQRTNIGLNTPQPSNEMATQQFSNNGTIYKHWNVFFKDIFRVGIVIIDRENRVITKEDLEKMFSGGENQQFAPPDLKISFVLKLHYMTSEDPQQATKMTQSGKGMKTLTQFGRDETGMSMAGLRVARREIIAKTKDWRIIKRIHRAIELRLK